MSKMIRIEDELYEQMKEEAALDGRSVASYVNRKLSSSAPMFDEPKYTKPKIEKVHTPNGQHEPTERTYQDVLSEITTNEKKRDEDLSYCQDVDEASKIRRFYQEEVAKLWGEYNEIKAQ